MTQRFRFIFWSALLLALVQAPLSVRAQDAQPSAAATPASPSAPLSDAAAPDAQTPDAQTPDAQTPDAQTRAATVADTAPAEQAPPVSDQTPQGQVAEKSPRGAVLSPERLQELKETLAEMQTRLQGAVETAAQAVDDGQVSVEVPALLNQDQVQDLLNTVSRLRWTLNDAMDVAGDMAVRAGEPQGTLVVSTKQMIGIIVGGAGAAVIVDLLGGGGLATATAAVVGAVGGYWAGSPDAWTWVTIPDGLSVPTSAPAPAPMAN